MQVSGVKGNIFHVVPPLRLIPSYIGVLSHYVFPCISGQAPCAAQEVHLENIFKDLESGGAQYTQTPEQLSEAQPRSDCFLKKSPVKTFYLTDLSLYVYST